MAETISRVDMPLPQSGAANPPKIKHRHEPVGRRHLAGLASGIFGMPCDCAEVKRIARGDPTASSIPELE